MVEHRGTWRRNFRTADGQTHRLSGVCDNFRGEGVRKRGGEEAR